MKLWILLFWGGILGQCNYKGCSSCGPNNTCLICNNNKGFINALEGICNKIESEDCNFIDGNGMCMECKKNFPANSLCLDLDPIQYCKRYDPDEKKGCVTCQEGYYLISPKVCKMANQLANCVEYKDRNTCSKCQSGYVLKNNACTPSLSNCVVESSLRCSECMRDAFPVENESSELDVFGRDFWTVVKELNSTVSPSVVSGSVICKRNPDPNCVSSFNLRNCRECKTGFYADAYKKCQRVDSRNIIEKCKTYDSATICSVCERGFYLYGNKCYANPRNLNILNCKFYSGINVCSRCMSGFYLENDSCTQGSTIANCDTLQNAQTCSQCSFGYYPGPNGCQIISPQFIPYCVSYAANGGCFACDTTHYLYNSTSCAPNTSVVANCLRYSTNSTCAECTTNYGLTGNVCVQVDIPNCRNYNADGSCMNCNSNFYVSGNRVCAPSRVIPQCEVMASATTCEFCRQRFSLTPDLSSCLPVPFTGCEVYQDANTCRGCPLGKYYSAEQNDCIIVPIPINNCFNYSSSNTCSLCTASTVVSLDRTSCIASTMIITNCLAYDQTSCKFCNEGFSLSADKTACTPIPVNPGDPCKYFGVNPTCLQCKNTHYLTPTGVCSPISLTNPNCYSYRATSYSALTDSCQRCVGNYFSPATNCNLQTSSVISNCETYQGEGQCSLCSSIAKLSGTVCLLRQTITNCLSYGPTNNCIVCASGFYPSNNGISCDPVAVGSIVSGCQRYVSATLCTECPFPAYVNTGSCTPAFNFPSNCKSLSSNSTCKACQTGFYADALGVCQPVNAIIEGCQEYSNATACAFCNSDRFLNYNECPTSRSIPYCLEYSSATTCKVCDSTSYPYQSSCIALLHPVAGCQIYSADSVCKKCASGFIATTNGGSCLANCEVTNPTSCLRCIPGFYKSTDSSCASVALQGSEIPNCAYYSEMRACMQCNSDFLLKNNICVPVPESQNCKSLTEGKECFVCQPGYEINGGNCVPSPTTLVITGCLLPLSNGSGCKVCNKEYYQVSFNGPCVPQPLS